MVYRFMNKQRGDTIIEVLLAMAVVGMVLGASFGTANRSLNIGRSAQERTVALKIAESQLELMKALNKNGISPPTSDFCVVASVFQPITDTSTGVPCSDLDSSAGGSGLYTIVISPPLAGGSYQINVSWDRLGGSAFSPRDEVNLYYRLGTL